MVNKEIVSELLGNEITELHGRLLLWELPVISSKLPNRRVQRLPSQRLVIQKASLLLSSIGARLRDTFIAQDRSVSISISAY